MDNSYSFDLFGDQNEISSFSPSLTPNLYSIQQNQQIQLQQMQISSPAMHPTIDTNIYNLGNGSKYTQFHNMQGNYKRPLNHSDSGQVQMQRNASGSLQMSNSKHSLLSPPNSFHLYPTAESLMPVTPFQLMNDNQGSHEIGPFDRVQLSPDIADAASANLLKENSNYQLLQMSNTGPSNKNEGKFKKTNHKEAEQRRRDILKRCFKFVKDVLPKFKKKNPSKEMVLKKARDYILDLQFESEQDKLYIEHLELHIDRLEDMIKQLNLKPIPQSSFNRQVRQKEVLEETSDED